MLTHFVCLSCRSLCLSIRLPVSLSVWQSLCLSVLKMKCYYNKPLFLCVCLSVPLCRSLHPSVRLSIIYPSINLLHWTIQPNSSNYAKIPRYSKECFKYRNSSNNNLFSSLLLSLETKSYPSTALPEKRRFGQCQTSLLFLNFGNLVPHK